MLSPPRRGNVLVFADGDDHSRPLERWILSIGLKPVLLRGREKFYFQVGDDDTIDAIVTDLDTDHPEAHALFERLLADDLFPGVPQLHLVRDPALHESLLHHRVDLVAGVLPCPVEAGAFKARLLLTAEIGRLRRRLQRSEMEDAATGLWNRRYLRFRLEQEFSRARRYRTPLSFVLFDVDRLAEFNDRHGQEAGDALVREVGRRLQGHVRKEDLCGRMSSNAFGVVLAGSRFRGAAVFANKVRSDIAARPFTHAGKTLDVRVSAGIAAYPAGDDVRRLEDLIDRAEAAVREAKERGRNRVHIDASTLAHAMPTVLIVDPVPAWAESAAALLREHDFVVLTASDPEEARRRARQAAPNLCVFDLAIMGPDDPLFAEALDAGAGRIARVGVSRDPEGDPERWPAGTFDRYLTMPFSLDLLLGAAKELTSEWHW